jgi:hypothetical protein
MNARDSENYLEISRSSSASKSVEIFWAEIYRGQLFLGPNLVSFNRTVVPMKSQGTAIIICERQRAPYGIKCVLGFFDKHGCSY